MRRWMFITTLAALALALVAGWTIGQLAGGGSGDAERIVPALPTIQPTANSTESMLTQVVDAAPESPTDSEDVIGSPPASGTPALVQRPTSVPQAP